MSSRVLTKAVTAAARCRGRVAVARRVVDPPVQHRRESHHRVKPKFRPFKAEVRIHYAGLGVVRACRSAHPDSLELVGAAPPHDIRLAADRAEALSTTLPPKFPTARAFAEGRAGAHQGCMGISHEEDLDVAPYCHQMVPIRRHCVRPALPESAAPRVMCTISSISGKGAREEGAGGAAIDAHRTIGQRDIEHLHGAVAEEQLGRLRATASAREVEAGCVEAARHDAERVLDFDVAALPRAVPPELGGCRSWCQCHAGAAERQEQQQRGH